MSSNHPAIRVSHLSKQYKLGGPQEPYHTLRDAIVNSLKAPLKVFHKTPPVEGFWALKDVSFDVEQGEVVGIIGRNGAGKSTLLKILSRITSPTEGTVELHGRVGSLLEVGTGFHPELTGRENIYLSGSILGMKRREIDAKLDDIVKFSEIEKFLDTPVKRYSSGMYVRLAFAVAAHLEPEILLVDEVLAVGDAAFQKKCLGKMGEVAKEGRTVLFVSHNMGAIGELCSRGIVLTSGIKTFEGQAKFAVDTYLKGINDTKKLQRTFRYDENKPLQILALSVINNEGEPTEFFDISDTVTIKIVYQVNTPTIGTNIMLSLSRNGIELACSFDTDYILQNLDKRSPGIHTIIAKIPRKILKAGYYTVSVGTGKINVSAFEEFSDIAQFEIQELSEDTSFKGYSQNRNGMIICPIFWEECVN
ncbi:polysaccharide ABC transporter ATP-binding protein [Methanoregula sp.]|uniref:ABC transporter ATP-binding protein n=1 Tax=Methanoregula sp. TaxID=2052170 RepID=UPI00356A6F89